MGDLALGLAKMVVEVTLNKVQSAIKEEERLQQSLENDLVFITGEFQMMQSFLNATNEERVTNDVVRTWVRQVRDLAYEVEDCIDSVVHLDKKSCAWWFRLRQSCCSCMAPGLPLDKAVAKLKQLKARAEDVSHRNARYNLITGSSSKPAAVVQQQPTATAGATAFDVKQEARDTARRHRGLVDLTELVANKDDLGLQVISLWGTGGDLGTTSVIKKAYDDRDVRQAFGCSGWAKLTRPYFNPYEFLRSLLTQFCAKSGQEQGATAGVDALTGMEAAAQDEPVKDFWKQVEEKRYLVVLEDVSTVVEWEAIRMYLPDRKNGSRIIVSTQQLEVASFCTTQPWGVSELMQLSADHSVCVFYSKEGRRPLQEIITKNKEFIDRLKASEDNGEKFFRKYWGKKVSIEKMKLAFEDTPHVVGREKESFSMDDLLCRYTNRIKVVSVWGSPGVGKSTLVRDVFYRAVRTPGFARCGWVDVPHSQPLDLREFSRSLLSDLHSESLEVKRHGASNLLLCDVLSDLCSDESLEVKKHVAFNLLLCDVLSPPVQNRPVEKPLEASMLGFVDPVEECRKLLHQEDCLVVIDGLRSTAEWDLIKAALVTPGATAEGTCIVVITDDASVATHCSIEDESVHNVKGLGAAAALDLFKEKVFKRNLEIPDPDMEQQANLLVDKCGGLPKVIVAVGGFLATKPKEAKEWRKLNDSFMHELKTNPRFDSLRGLFIRMQSYFRTCPDYLKPCIFYLSIFPGEKTSIRRRRLVRRWIAEGYSRDMDGRTAEEKAEMFFSELAGLSIIQQPPETATATYVHKRMFSCQVNGFFRDEYISSWPVEENLAFALEGSASIGATQCRWRHIAISRRWDTDINVYRSIDFSPLRSLTVFGEWNPFFVSEGMKLLRVLDLEDTSGLTDIDLEQIAKLVPRLKFLSLRGCSGIHHLPDSLGGLTQLETLDARYTSVVVLPTFIVKMQKLQYLRAGAVPLDTAAASPSPSTPWTISRLLRGHPRPAGPHVGVQVPRGGIVGKMTTLHTLGVVDVNVTAAGQGKAVLKELRNLTQLRKLGVSGINRANSKELWSAISGLVHLESLSARLEDASDGDEQGFYGGCSDGTVFSPPMKLQSLKLYGLVGWFPAWINQLQNLRRLNLHTTILEQKDIYVLGDLPNLRILRLCLKPVQDGELHFCSKPEVDALYYLPRSFVCLGVLEITCNSSLQQIIFGINVMPALELLKVRVCSGSSLLFSGLRNLYSIKRIFLKDYKEALAVKENLEREIGGLEDKPDLELE